jgi:chromosome segregation ATPase
MLTDMVQSSLSIFAADRHRYQAQAVEMVRETLDAVKTQLENTVTETQAKVDSSDKEKASRAAALEQAQANLASIEESTSSGKSAVESDKAAVVGAKESLAAAQAAIEAKEAHVASLRENKSKLESALKELYEPLKTAKASGWDGNKAVKTLVTIFADIGMEAGLVDSLPETLKKDPEARGTFDGIVAQHVETQTSAYSGKAEKEIAEAEQSTKTLTDGKSSAESSLAAAKEKLEASTAALQAAEGSVKDSKAAFKAAQHAMGSFEKEMSTAGGSLEGAKKSLASFVEGPLKAFVALKDLAAAVEPEPEVAEAPVAQDVIDATSAVAGA